MSLLFPAGQTPYCTPNELISAPTGISLAGPRSRRIRGRRRRSRPLSRSISWAGQLHSVICM